TLGARQKNLEIRKSEDPIGGLNEFLAPDGEQQVEDLLIQHFPGADLLLDHVEACLLGVHTKLITNLRSKLQLTDGHLLCLISLSHVNREPAALLSGSVRSLGRGSRRGL